MDLTGDPSQGRNRLGRPSGKVAVPASSRVRSGASARPHAPPVVRLGKLWGGGGGRRVASGGCGPVWCSLTRAGEPALGGQQTNENGAMHGRVGGHLGRVFFFLLAVLALGRRSSTNWCWLGRALTGGQFATACVGRASGRRRFGGGRPCSAAGAPPTCCTAVGVCASAWIPHPRVRA